MVMTKNVDGMECRTEKDSIGTKDIPEGVYYKSIVQLSLQYFITSFYNRLSNMFIQQSGLTISDRRCLLNLRQTVDNLRMH